MRIFITSVLLVAWGAGAAAADPCEVMIARAPAELRAAVETALSAEAHCSVALELRAVPTEGGYYLLARDMHGRVRERIVPDAASAATLVTSWASDDELDDTKRAVAQAPPSASEAIAVVVAATSAPEPPTFIGLYGIAGPSLGSGLRAEVDLVRRGRWSFGAAAMWRGEGSLATFTDTFDNPTSGLVHVDEYDALGYVAYERDLSNAWHVRGSLGLGISVVDVSMLDPALVPEVASTGPLTSSSTGTMGIADGSLMIAADLGVGFSLVAGVIVDAYVAQPTLVTESANNDTVQYSLDRTVSWSLLLGLRYAL
jgi:hypothetical protein